MYCLYHLSESFWNFVFIQIIWLNQAVDDELPKEMSKHCQHLGEKKSTFLKKWREGLMKVDLIVYTYCQTGSNQVLQWGGWQLRFCSQLEYQQGSFLYTSLRTVTYWLLSSRGPVFRFIRNICSVRAGSRMSLIVSRCITLTWVGSERFLTSFQCLIMDSVESTQQVKNTISSSNTHCRNVKLRMGLQLC